uniref:Secreted protein n=1 Tax=Oryza nivara TaxID=4536 RepID=A0A0E0ID45_ORYNI
MVWWSCFGCSLSIAAGGKVRLPAPLPDWPQHSARKQAAASPTSEEQGRCLPISIPKNENADDDGTELSCLICLIGSAA